MLRFCSIATLALIPTLMAVSSARGQSARPQQPGATAAQKGAAAPRHDISGTWDPGNNGIQPLGPRNMPEDGKPEHQIPYTPLGLEVLNSHKPSNGVRSVLPGETNDPVVYCDPQGMPREDLYELRTTQIIQTPLKVFILYEFGKIWRVIWTDGRELPKDPDPRWYGYSVGKWEDDYTFVVETVGMDERTWLDNAGDPHSGEMRVEERYHRVNQDSMELTVKIDDPKTYTEPWLARDRLHLKLLPANTDIMEMICAPTEAEEYKKTVANPLSK
jgi:hypothetical protein